MSEETLSLEDAFNKALQPLNEAELEQLRQETLADHMSDQ